MKIQNCFQLVLALILLELMITTDLTTTYPTVATTELPLDICQQPLNLGVGIPFIRLDYYYYNSTNNTCAWFNYLGNGGNDNKFDNISSCQERCVTTSSILPLSATSSSVIPEPTNTCEGSGCRSESDAHGSDDRSPVLSYLASTTTHLTLTTHSSTQSSVISTISSSSSSAVAMTTSTLSSSNTQPSDNPSIFFYMTIIVIFVIVVVCIVTPVIISGMFWRRHKKFKKLHTIKTSWTTNQTQQNHLSPSTSNSSSDIIV